MVIQSSGLLLFPATMAFAASSDLLTMTISNRVTVTLLAGFFALALAVGMPGEEMLSHLAAGAAVLVVTFVFFACGWIGGGDAKLAAVTALWFGFDHLLTFAIYASLLGGVLTIAIIRFRRMPLPKVLEGHEWIERLHRLDAGVPYGIALGLAALLVYPNTEWMRLLG